MPQNQQPETGSRRRKGPGRLSRWMQHRANTRAVAKIRGGNGSMMGMDLLVLHTVGRHSGQAWTTPVAWFPIEDGARVVVGSGGGGDHPDWYANLSAHPDRTSVELPGQEPFAVAPRTLQGEEREQAWRVVANAQPRIAKYQSKADRQYPLVRLDPA